MDLSGTAPERDSRIRGRVLGVACVVAALVAGVSFFGTAHATASPPQISGSPAAPTASEISPVCTTTTPAKVLGPATTSLPTKPVSTLVTPNGGVTSFSATATNLYVSTGSQLITYSLTGSPVGAFSLPAMFTVSNQVSQPVVDPSGNIYLSSYYGAAIDKFSPTGTLLWSVDPQKGNPTGLFSVGTGANFQLVVSLTQDTASSLILNLSTGATTGTFPLIDHIGDYVTQTSGGNLLFSGNGYVETVSPAGKVLSTFGAPNIEGNGGRTASGQQFYYPGQAVQGPDGTIYTADPLHSMEATAPSGLLQGSTTLGGNLNFGGWGFVLVGSTFYFQSGPPFNAGGDAISSFSLSSLQAFLGITQAPSDSLGWGAGITTPATANYFTPGTTPTVDATFDPWWTSIASHLELSYSVWNDATLNAETVPAPTVVALPTTATGLATMPLALPSADTAPGPYEVQATLLDTSTSPPATVGTTCLSYAIGATGDKLNFSTLPTGVGSGGPADPRGVALSAQMGLTGRRSMATLNWAAVLPNCNSSHPTAATCGASALVLSSLSTDPYRAAYLAKADNVAYWIQLSGGDAVPTALVNAGFWQADVAAIVSHYATVPAGCGSCAPVTMWEPWNEPNNTGWANGATYVSSVLKPFYNAVKSVEPGTTSTVLGGSSLEPVPGWWQQVIAAGGLSSMDVAAIHPYTGSDDTYDEDGMATQVRQLQALLGKTPLWFSEVGWWGDGDYDFLNQANAMSTSLIWQKVLGVPVESYFIDEGSWGNNGISFSLVQAVNSDDYVKPSGLATMTTTGMLAGRSATGTPATGIPHTVQADFSPTSGGTTALSAVWSDGLPVTASVTVTAPSGGTVPVTVTNQYGAATTAQATSGQAYSLPLSGEVSYLSYPTGDTLTVSPTEHYGTDVGSAAAGAKATATSGNASAAIAGDPVGNGLGWTSASGDTTPALTDTFASTTTLDRILVDTQSVGSTATGVRNYTLSADEPGTGWVTLATETGQYRNHILQFSFPSVAASAIRITVGEVDFGGYYGGGIPPWWSATQIGPAFLHSIEAYAGTGGPAVVAGTALTPLTGGSSSGGTGGGTTTTVAPPTTTSTALPTTTTVPGGSTTTTDPGGSTTTTDPGGSTTTDPGGSTTTTSAEDSSTTTTVPPVDSAHSVGYRMITSAGQMFTFGTDDNLGPDGALSLNRPIVGMAANPDGKGYWLVGSDGGIFNFGDASFYGSTGAMGLNAPIVGMAATRDGAGYWLVGGDGGIFATGDARYLGSTGAWRLNRPVVGMTRTTDGKGYWLVASDGGVFAFGDAGFFGSAGDWPLEQPIVGMATTPDGKGYWLVATDGGVFTFGDAAFYGSIAGLGLNEPIVSMTATPDGNGYWLAASDGGVFAFGDAAFYGSTPGTATGQPVVAITG